MGVGIRMGSKGSFSGHINIYSTANATVTATIGDSSYTATCDGNGYGQIRVKKKGTYTITSTGTTRVGHAVVANSAPVTATYNWSVYNLNNYYTDDVKGSWSYDSYAYVYGANSYTSYPNYSFNSATGTYSGVGSYQSTGIWPLPSASHFNAPSAVIFSNGQVYRTVGYQTWLYQNSIKVSRSSSVGGSMTLHEATYHQDKGSYYTQVSSSSLNGYPSDGIQDGYWYVAI